MEQHLFQEGYQLMQTLEDVLSKYTSCPIKCTWKTKQWSTALNAIIEELAASTTFEMLFNLLATKRERILVCISHTPVQAAIDAFLDTFKKKKCNCGKKDATKAANIRDHGNKFFSRKEYLQAFAIYTTGLMFAPEDSSEASMLYGNRSAAYFYLEQYENALEDVDRALALGYERHKPIGLLLLRKAECLLELGRIQEAKDLLKVNETKAPAPGTDKRASWDELKKQTNKASKRRTLKRAVSLTENQDLSTVSKALTSKRLFQPHPKYPWLSDKVDMRYDHANGGYYLVTSKAMAFAEVIAVEKPLAALALDKVGHRRCHHCLSSCYKSATVSRYLCDNVIIAVQRQSTPPERFYAPVPCTTCSNVLFCSEQCRAEAWQAYHRFECAHLPLLLHSVDKSTHLALRMLYSAGQFKQLKTNINLEEQSSKKKKKKLLGRFDDPNQYDILYQVMQVEEKEFKELEFKEQLRQAITACLLAKLALESKYLPNSTRDELLAGCLLQRHLSQLKVNQHYLVHTKQFDLYELASRNADSFQQVSGVASMMGASCAGNVLLRPYSQTNLMQSSVNVYGASRRIPVGTKLVIDLRSYVKDASFQRLEDCQCSWCSTVDPFPIKCITCQSMMINSGADDGHYRCSSTKCTLQMNAATVQSRMTSLEKLVFSVKPIVDYFDALGTTRSSIFENHTKLHQFADALQAIEQIAHPNACVLLHLQERLFKGHAKQAICALSDGPLEMFGHHTDASMTYAEELLTRYQKMAGGNNLDVGRFLSRAMVTLESLTEAKKSAVDVDEEEEVNEMLEVAQCLEHHLNKQLTAIAKSIMYEFIVAYYEWRSNDSPTGCSHH